MLSRFWSQARLFGGRLNPFLEIGLEPMLSRTVPIFARTPEP